MQICKGGFVGLKKSVRKVSEDEPVSVCFYYLIEEKEYLVKSIQELIIKNLNHRVKELSEGRICTEIFHKRDLESVTPITFNHSSHRLISVHLSLRQDVLHNSESLIPSLHSIYHLSPHIISNSHHHAPPPHNQHHHHRDHYHPAPDIKVRILEMAKCDNWLVELGKHSRKENEIMIGQLPEHENKEQVNFNELVCRIEEMYKKLICI